MQKEKLKLIVRNLKSLVDLLESEVYSDPDAYVVKSKTNTYTTSDNDDDGYPD
jgi:hypothetical protein